MDVLGSWSVLSHAFHSTAITHNCYLTQEKCSLIKQTIIANCNRTRQDASCLLVSYEYYSHSLLSCAPL
jgi:hypothetical protein